MEKREIKMMAAEIARSMGGSPDLVNAVIKIESNFDPYAKGAAGEIGLMQLLPQGAIKDWEMFHQPLNYWKPENNITVGTWYLTVRIPQLLKRYDYEINRKNIIWSYNAGIGNLLNGVYPDSTQNYYHRVQELTRSTPTFFLF